jgi:hypothetical protein
MAEKELKSYQYPHYAQIVFSVNIHKKLSDGSLDPKIVSEEELHKYGITKKAIFSVEGYDKANCIQKVKETLEKLNEQI